MAITKTWNITGMTNTDGVVETVSWELVGTDSETGKTAKLGDTVGLNPANTSNFTDFNSLTRDQVIDWVKALEEADTLENAIETRLNRVIGGPSTDLPSSW
jgi:hypothetical protein